MREHFFRGFYIGTVASCLSGLPVAGVMLMRAGHGFGVLPVVLGAMLALFAASDMYDRMSSPHPEGASDE